MTMNKASEGDWIPAELFQIQNYDALKALHSSLEYSAVDTRLEKVSFIPIPKKSNAKECSTDHTIALISPASMIMLKIL